jgi:sugar lactone lactonase YvrE
MLGGPDRRTLFVATAETHEPEAAKAKPSGRIEIVTVDVPGAGLP